MRLEATRNAGATIERQGSPLGCKKTCGRKQGDENCWDKAYVHRVFVGSIVLWWSFYLKVTIQVHHGVTSPQRRFRCFANELKKLKSKISMACSSKYIRIYIYTNSSQTSERYLRDATWCHLMLDVFASEKWWLQSVAVGRRQYLGPLLLSMAWVVRSLKETCPFSMSDFLPFERCWMLVWVFMMAHGWLFAQLIRCLICTLMAFCWICISISFISFYI